MKKSRIFQSFAAIAIVVFFVCGQQAVAQHHLQLRVVSGPQANVHPPKGPKEKAVLQQLSSGFGFLPPVDGGGNDEWPCFPNQNANGADCSQISTGGVVIGAPAYTQSLSACNANTNTSTNCGQVFWFYEDDTNDNTDDLVVSIVVKQGVDYILDSGPYNFGPNPFSPGTVIIISDDAAFGTLGQTGPGNGYCAGSTESCINPKPGIATVTITTTVGTSTIKSSFKMFLE